MPDMPDIPVWGAMIIWALTVVLAWFSGKGFDSLRKWRGMRMAEQEKAQEARMREQAAEDHRSLAGYIELIVELRANQQHLGEELRRIVEKHDREMKDAADKHEKAMAAMRSEHVTCLENQAELKAKNAMLETKQAAMERDIASLREWRHDVANQANAAVLRAEVDKTQS